jgi:hypothetical protein
VRETANQCKDGRTRYKDALRVRLWSNELMSTGAGGRWGEEATRPGRSTLLASIILYLSYSGWLSFFIHSQIPTSSTTRLLPLSSLYPPGISQPQCNSGIITLCVCVCVCVFVCVDGDSYLSYSSSGLPPLIKQCAGFYRGVSNV